MGKRKNSGTQTEKEKVNLTGVIKDIDYMDHDTRAIFI